MLEVNVIVFTSTSDDDELDQLLQKNQTSGNDNNNNASIYYESISGLIVRYCRVSHEWTVVWDGSDTW